MAEVDLDRPSPPPMARALRSRWASGLIWLAIVPLIGFIGLTGRSLWAEWHGLRRNQEMVSASVPVGYIGINPNPSYATRPDNWFHHEGEATLLWSGWKGTENGWYRFGRGEILQADLSLPIGQDAIQAIDHPIFEQKGGERWTKIDAEALVVVFDPDKDPSIYPVRVLNKVELINDPRGDQPVLVAFTPVVDAVDVYDARSGDRRVTFGHSGYFLGYHPILYDRSTVSLWVARDGDLTAVAGKRKGEKLARIARLSPSSWSDCQARHEAARLLVGGDRTKQKQRE